MRRRPGHDGRRGARAAGATLLAAGTLLLAGCLSEGDAPATGSTYTGVWSRTLDACRERLVLRPDGSFVWSSARGGPVVSLHTQVAGAYGAAGAGIRFHPAGALPAGVPYCRQWSEGRIVSVPWAELEPGLGYHPAEELAHRLAVSPALGGVLVGTGPGRRERFVVWRAGDRLKGTPLDDPLASAGPLYGSLPGDANRDPALRDTYLPAYHLPGGFYAHTFTISADITAGTSLQELILNFTAAADVTFVAAGDDATPPCHFQAYEDRTFTTKLAVLDATAAEQTVRFNPADSGQSYLEESFSTADGTITIYRLPVEVVRDTAGTCRVWIHARASAVAELERLADLDDFEPALDVALPAQARALASPRAAGQRLSLLRVEPGVLARVLGAPPSTLVTWPRLAPDAEGRAPAFDVLDLLGTAGTPREVSVQRSAGTPHLAVFPEGRSEGLGPFLPGPGDGAGMTVRPPQSVSARFDGAGEVHTYAVAVERERRVALRSTGGLDLRARLFDADGRLLAGDDDGAADGAGFHLAHTLVPGRHALHVGIAAGTGAYTLVVEDAAAPAVTDEALEACLRAGGLERDGLAGITRVSCVRRGVASLDGLQGATGLRRLELGGNRVSDLTPLSGLPLRVLSLAGNPLGSLAPLAGLDELQRLSLAGAPVTAADLADLAPLADTLAWLNLRRVAAVAEADLAALQGRMPFTTVVAPDGTVRPATGL